MPVLRSPILWIGGKGGSGGVSKEILPMLEATPHLRYVEVFGGGASIMFKKKPSPIEIYNDIDGRLVNLFRVLRDDVLFERFQHLVNLTLHSREEWRYGVNHMNDETLDDAERARAFYTACRQSFGGTVDRAWALPGMTLSKHGDMSISNWISSLDRLQEIHARLRTVSIERQPFEKILSLYDNAETLFYLDPPYIPETRRDGGYAHEMTVEDHQHLVLLLLDLNGHGILSGYNDGKTYAPLEAAGWRRLEFETTCSVVGRTRASKLQGEGAFKDNGQTRTECLWISPGVQTSKQSKLWSDKVTDGYNV